MFRSFRPALAVLAIVGLVAAGCGGSKGTPTPPPISDPNEVIVRSVESLKDVNTLHIRINVSGKVDLAAISGGQSSGGLGGSIDLAGTYVEGDVDITKKDTQDVKADLTLGMPGLLGLTGRVIVVDGYTYTKTSLTGDKYNKSPVGSSVPVDVPSAVPSASGDIATQIADLQKSLTQYGATTSLKGNAKVDGKDCYDIAIDIPASKLNELLASAGSATPSMSVESVKANYYVYKENLRPAKIALAVTVTGIGSPAVEIIISRYDQSVNIKAPADSEVQESPSV